MSSYKPVIYVFGAIGALVLIGLIATAVQGIRAMSRMSALNYSSDSALEGDSTFNMRLDDGSATGSSAYPRYSDIRSSDPEAMEIDDRSTSDDSYRGPAVLYTTLRDKNVMSELKLPEDVDPGLRSLLTRADTSLQELYRSDTHLALKMVALNEERQTILIQDLRNGNIYDTAIDGRGNFVVLGNEIHSLMTDPDDRQHLDELVIHQTYTIATNATLRVFLPDGESYTRKVEPTGSVGDISVKNGKIETKVYSTKTPARFDTDRVALRTESN